MATDSLELKREFDEKFSKLLSNELSPNDFSELLDTLKALLKSDRNSQRGVAFLVLSNHEREKAIKLLKMLNRDDNNKIKFNEKNFLVLKKMLPLLGNSIIHDEILRCFHNVFMPELSPKIKEIKTSIADLSNSISEALKDPENNGTLLGEGGFANVYSVPLYPNENQEGISREIAVRKTKPGDKQTIPPEEDSPFFSTPLGESSPYSKVRKNNSLMSQLEKGEDGIKEADLPNMLLSLLYILDTMQTSKGDKIKVHGDIKPHNVLVVSKERDGETQIHLECIDYEPTVMKRYYASLPDDLFTTSLLFTKDTHVYESRFFINAYEHDQFSVLVTFLFAYLRKKNQDLYDNLYSFAVSSARRHRLLKSAIEDIEQTEPELAHILWALMRGTSNLTPLINSPYFTEQNPDTVAHFNDIRERYEKKKKKYNNPLLTRKDREEEYPGILVLSRRVQWIIRQTLLFTEATEQDIPLDQKKIEQWRKRVEHCREKHPERFDDRFEEIVEKTEALLDSLEIETIRCQFVIEKLASHQIPASGVFPQETDSLAKCLSALLETGKPLKLRELLYNNERISPLLSPTVFARCLEIWENENRILTNKPLTDDQRINLLIVARFFQKKNENITQETVALIKNLINPNPDGVESLNDMLDKFFSGANPHVAYRAAVLGSPEKLLKANIFDWVDALKTPLSIFFKKPERRESQNDNSKPTCALENRRGFQPTPIIQVKQEARETETPIISNVFN